MSASPGDITDALVRIQLGDSNGHSRLARLVHVELRRLAGFHMRKEPPGHILQPSALVNEAFLRLMDQDAPFADRQHFFSVASQVMRRILVDYARKHRAAKRGGGAVPEELNAAVAASGGVRAWEILSLHEALLRLSEIDERQARIVEMRYFGGMPDEEIAQALGVSVRTVLRDWRSARAWLHAQLSE